MRFYNDEFYVKDPDEMKARFRPGAPRRSRNTVAIAERCAVSFDTDGLHLPTFTAPDGRPPADYFRDLAREGPRAPPGGGRRADARSRARSPPEKYRERLEYEIGVIEKMGFPSYFLIVSDFIRHAREKGIAVGPGRGSAAGLDRLVGPAHHRDRPAPLRPALRAVPEPRADLDARHRHRLLPGAARRGHRVRHEASTAARTWRRS